MKYKVGDKVGIKSYDEIIEYALKHENNLGSFHSVEKVEWHLETLIKHYNFSKYFGRITEITEIQEYPFNGIKYVAYKLSINENDNYYWQNWMLKNYLENMLEDSYGV